jgi:hypothetical protein
MIRAVQLPTCYTIAVTADVQNASTLNAQVVSGDPRVLCVSKGDEENVMSMGCVRGKGRGYMKVHTVAGTYLCVAKRGYS